MEGETRPSRGMGMPVSSVLSGKEGVEGVAEYGK